MSTATDAPLEALQKAYIELSLRSQVLKFGGPFTLKSGRLVMVLVERRVLIDFSKSPPSFSSEAEDKSASIDHRGSHLSIVMDPDTAYVDGIAPAKLMEVDQALGSLLVHLSGLAFPDQSLGHGQDVRTCKHLKVSLMLAETFAIDGNVDPTGWWLSEKLDGVRAYWDGSSIWSRASVLYDAPQDFKDKLPTDMSLDGELWMERDAFDRTSGIIRSGTSGWKKWDRIIYMVRVSLLLYRIL
ncbi:unnamed protein product [Tilletia controversa]|nr:unnamed protein product [Tilletia controversa]